MVVIGKLLPKKKGISKASLHIIALFLSVHPFCSHSSIFDFYIYKYGNRFLKPYVAVYGGEIFKAQLYQESLLNPNAISRAGAAGIGQIMPDTFLDLKRKLKLPEHVTVFSAEHNIMSSAYYLSTLLAQWHVNRPMSDRLSLGWSSYNAGLGNMLAAQKRCNMAIAYKDIIECLPKITGVHSKETELYVQRIWGHYIKMRFLK